MEQGVVEELIHLQLPEVEAVDVVNVPDGNGDGDGDGDGDGNDAWERQLDEVQMQAMRLENPQVAMLLDAPHEPPIELHHMLEPVNVPQRPRKKRSFLTISKPFHVQPERCALISNGWRAVQCVQPDKRGEYFANYLIKHMTSRNYPNGEGLPNRWGQF
ncbi:male-specific protein scotti [Drosophila novamexicana]|uniref:male-specific protein scotti n=1 Tax=Drosophila novamexicana TaxID=47314 RepID=UPI0011E5D917|nr:male-specific protein scotti [Drosophila novamexicana]